MSEAGGASNSGCSVVPVLHRQHRQPVRDQDEDEQRDRERQHERRDPHADGRLDLVAHLDGDGLQEQLHPVGHTDDVIFAPQEERQRDHDHRGDRGRDTVSMLTRQKPNQFGLLVLADLDRRLRRGLVSVIACASLLSQVCRSCAMPSSPATPSSAPAAPETSASPNTTPSPVGRKTKAIVSPITVMTSSRVAEFSAILLLSGCASAVIESTERCTSTRVEQTQTEPDAEERPNHDVTQRRAAANRRSGQRDADQQAAEMAETQRKETPTARPALASSPCYLNPACLEDA